MVYIFMMMMNIWSWLAISDEYLMNDAVYVLSCCSTRDAIARDISAAAIQSFLITCARSSIISQGNGEAMFKHSRFHTSALAIEFPDRRQSPETIETLHSNLFKNDQKCLESSSSFQLLDF